MGSPQSGKDVQMGEGDRPPAPSLETLGKDHPWDRVRRERALLRDASDTLAARGEASRWSTLPVVGKRRFDEGLQDSHIGKGTSGGRGKGKGFPKGKGKGGKGGGGRGGEPSPGPSTMPH